MWEVARFLWSMIQVLVGYNLIMPFLLVILYCLKRKKSIPSVSGQSADYAVILTVYRYTDTLPAAVDSLLQLNYPNFLIYLVADNCHGADIHFEDERVIVLKPEEILANNVRSHFYAIDRFKRNHSRLAIVDSDNLVDSELLNELNKYFEQGYQAVQGLRKPKNLDSTLACLDAARDIYYHFYDGKVLFGAGSSATLSGSGMAFTTSLYNDCLADYDMSGAGFDKVLQGEIVNRDQRIAFAENAVLYDAKTSKSSELVNQRSRWIGTWFRYSSMGYKLVVKGIFRGSWNQFVFGLILLRPPLFIFLLASGLLMSINFILDSNYVWIWASGFLLFMAAFAIALLTSNTDKRIYRSLINIPRFMLLQVVALFRFLLNRSTSVSTRHSETI